MTVAEQFETRAAGWVHTLLLMEEERRPLPDDPSPAMLVARVTERLSQAAIAIGDQECGDKPLQAGVFLVGTAAFALTAISHIQRAETAPTRIKDALLERLDRDVVEALESESIKVAPAGELVLATLGLLAGANQYVAELEGVDALPLWDADDDSEEWTLDELLLEIERDAECPDTDDEVWEGHLLEELKESLWQVATMAAAAAEHLIERSEDLR